jgi:hypothetical protein
MAGARACWGIIKMMVAGQESLSNQSLKSVLSEMFPESRQVIITHLIYDNTYHKFGSSKRGVIWRIVCTPLSLNNCALENN